MINTNRNFIEHLKTNQNILSCDNRKNIHEATENFWGGIAHGETADAAFQNAILAFQEKVNPSQDMLVTSEKIAQTAKEAIKPNPENLMSWIDTLNATVPMLQVYNEWVNHLNANKDQSHVFYA